MNIGSRLLFNKQFCMTGVWNHLPRGVKKLCKPLAHTVKETTVYGEKKF